MNHSVYILNSYKLNRYYIGYTSNFDTRLEFHKNAESRKFTANANDWTLFLKIDCQNKTQALAIEKHIKSMKSKTYVENLLKYPEITIKLLEKYNSDG
jgi:putative endonuclease